MEEEILNRASKLLAAAFALYGISTLTSMAGMSIGAGLLAIAIFLYAGGPAGLWKQLRAEDQSVVSRVYLGASAFFALVCVLSLVVAAYHPLEYGGRHSEVHVLRDSAKLWYLFWPFVLAAFLRVLPEEARWKALKAWVLAFAAISVIGVIQYFTGFPRAQAIPGNAPYYHAVLFFGHHLSTASIWIFPFFAVLDLAANRESTARIGLPRWFLVVAGVLGATVLFMTFSRTAWVATPVALLVWVLLRLRWRAALGVCALIALGLALTFQVPAVRSRLTNSMGTSERFELWRANLDFFKERPITGAGWRHNQELSGYYLMEKQRSEHVFSGHAHNVVLDLLGGTGLLGLWGWIVWMMAATLPLWFARASGHLPLANGFICAWLAFLINGLTQVNFWEAKVEHQLSWVVAWTLVAFSGKRIRG